MFCRSESMIVEGLESGCKPNCASASAAVDTERRLRNPHECCLTVWILGVQATDGESTLASAE